MGIDFRISGWILGLVAGFEDLGLDSGISGRTLRLDSGISGWILGSRDGF